MRFWVLGCGLAAIGALALSGCNSSTTTDDSKKDSGSTQTNSGKKIVLGFSQIGNESGWRTANTKSIKEEAEKRGIDLKFSDAQNQQTNQIKAINDFISQGVDVIAFSPVVVTGWGPVLKKAKDAGIPVIVSDRRPDVPDDLYVTFIGSDFIEEGKRAGEWMAQHCGGKATIAELTGTPGSAPANDRAKGFRDAIAKYPGMKIVYSQTGDFKRSNGKEVMEALLKSDKGKSITALFAHNDDMAIGAIQAIKEAGKKPGKDIMVVSIDGVKDALEAIKTGELNCSVECNALLGPFLMDAVEKVAKGEKDLPKRTVVKDNLFDSTNAAQELPNRKY